jgi:DNA-binding NtrC family response regulator
MPLLSSRDRRIAQAIVDAASANPFLNERVELERIALGKEFVGDGQIVQFRPGLKPDELFPNSARLEDRAEVLAKKMRARLSAGPGESVAESELILYEDLVLTFLYRHCKSHFNTIIRTPSRGGRSRARIEYWPQFRREFGEFLHLPGRALPSQHDATFVFAWFFQISRAFVSIFDNIIGSSMTSARLRADVWQSIFTHDVRRYVRGLHQHMRDIATLITGPSGSGKELAARAIGLSRFVEFDAEREQFAEDYVDSYYPLNLSALAPTLIESELFGHKRGAFTGAQSDKQGWLEVCGPHGTVFLDEIGELDPSIQVKLLRLLEERLFYRVGEVRPKRHFKGKFVTATNRDLTEEIQRGRFREDLYFRLCADVVITPSLREQLAEAPSELLSIVRFVTGNILPDDIEGADKLASEAAEWIERNLGLHYDWPGNIRELEQCVRNIMVRGTYRPLKLAVHKPDDPREAFAQDVVRGTLTSDQLLRRYYALVYSQAGSYDAAATRLQVNWRTVRKKVDPDLIQTYRTS